MNCRWLVGWAVLVALLLGMAGLGLRGAGASDLFDELDDDAPTTPERDPNPPEREPDPPEREPERPAASPRAGEPPLVPTAPAGLPEPTESEQTQSRVLLKQIFQEDYAKTTAPARRALAQKLMDEAARTRDDRSAVYVMLTEAADIAAAGGDGATAVRALDRLAQVYEVDYLKRVLPLLESAAKAGPAPPEIARGTAQRAIEVCDRAIREYRLSTAVIAASIAVKTAPRAKDAALLAAAREKVQEVGGYRKAFPSLSKAVKTLRARPDDAASLLMLGRFNCFARAEWSRGLPGIAEGAPSPLKALAEKDIALRRRLDQPDDDDQINEAMEKLAQEWWAAADAVVDDDLAAAALRSRGSLWYARLVPRLKLLEGLKVRKLLDQARMPGLRPGLVGHYYGNHSFTTASLRRIDPQVNFFWKQGPPVRGMPADGFAIFWRGYIKAPQAGRYRITVWADDGSRVWIDGKIVIDAWHNLHAPEEEFLLTGQPQTLQVEYPEITGNAHVRLGWKTPGSNKVSPIPATALWHDRGGTHRIAQPWPEGVQRFEGHSYHFFSQNIPWHAARQFCEDMGGHLLTIETPAEQQFAARLAAGRTPWIGLSDEREEGTFRWLNGTRPIYTAWHPGDPNNGEMADFVVLWEHGLWADDWNGHREFICEWDE